MINLRFHIVSLVAVFFALAIGIAVGAAVVDQGVLNQTEARLSQFDRTLQERNATIEELEKTEKQNSVLLAQLTSRSVARRLEGRFVVVVGTAEAKESDLDAVRELLENAGANVQATFALTDRLALVSDEDRSRAGAIVGTLSTSADDLREPIDTLLVGGLLNPLLVPSLQPFVAANFIDTFGESLRVIHSDSDLVLVDALTHADTESYVVATNFVNNVQQAGDLRLLVVNAPSVRVGTSPKDAAAKGGASGKGGKGGKAQSGKKATRPVPHPVLSMTRTNYRASASTVDNTADLAGQTALIFAFEDLARSRVGQYGTAKGATRLVPKQ
jgi:hypothetical protein